MNLQAVAQCSFQQISGVQFYAGGSLVGGAGKFDQIHQANEGFCLETQQFPDAPNHRIFMYSSFG